MYEEARDIIPIIPAVRAFLTGLLSERHRAFGLSSLALTPAVEFLLIGILQISR